MVKTKLRGESRIAVGVWASIPAKFSGDDIYVIRLASALQNLGMDAHIFANKTMAEGLAERDLGPNAFIHSLPDNLHGNATKQKENVRVHQINEVIRETGMEAMVFHLWPMIRDHNDQEVTRVIKNNPDMLAISQMRDIMGSQHRMGFAAAYLDSIMVLGDRRFSQTYAEGNEKMLHVGCLGDRPNDMLHLQEGGVSQDGDVIIYPGNHGEHRERIEEIGAWLDVALESKGKTHLNDKKWRVILPESFPKGMKETLMRKYQSDDAIVFDPPKSWRNFITLLGKAPLVISGGGAGTINDAISLNKPLLIFPLESQFSQEQVMRAEIFSALPHVTSIGRHDLARGAEHVAFTINEITSKPPSEVDLNFSGSRNAARLIYNSICAKREIAPREQPDFDVTGAVDVTDHAVIHLQHGLGRNAGWTDYAL